MNFNFLESLIDIIPDNYYIELIKKFDMFYICIYIMDKDKKIPIQYICIQEPINIKTGIKSLINNLKGVK